MGLESREKDEVRAVLRDKIVKKIDEYEESKDMNKEFYFKLFSREDVYKVSLLHSAYTLMGSQWENFAEILSQNEFDEVERREVVHGNISDSARSRIDSILDGLDRGEREPDIRGEIKEVLELAEEGRKESISQQVDLILTKDDARYYIELKAPKPNKNEVKSAKSDLLKLVAMNGGGVPYLCMPYNPYFTEEYDRWTVMKFVREGEDLLVGKDFWDFVGGEGAYEDLLQVFEEVGKEIDERLNDI